MRQSRYFLGKTSKKLKYTEGPLFSLTFEQNHLSAGLENLIFNY
jgi:hypothetical protein